MPTNIKEIQRFLGLAGWYHRFVQDFSRIDEPVNALKTGMRFSLVPTMSEGIWTSEILPYLTSCPWQL